MKLSGIPFASKLTLTNDSNVPIIDADGVNNFMISGLWLDGNEANNTITAHIGLINIDNCDNVTVEKCFVSESDAAGIVATDSDVLAILDNTCIENNDDGIEVFTGCDGVIISHNRLIDNSPGNEPTPSGCLKIRNNNTGVIISSNTIMTQYPRAVIFFTSNGGTPNSTGNSLTGNTIVNTNVTGFGIYLFGGGTGSDLRHWNITGNSITASQGTGVFFSTWVRDILLSGNIIVAFAGIDVDNATREKINIVGNTFVAYPGSGGDIGIKWKGIANGVTMTLNTISGFDTMGIQLANVCVPTNCSIICNTVTGNPTMILTMVQPT